MSIAKTRQVSGLHIFEIGKVDDKRRITLPRMKLAQYYEIEVTSSEEIILRPRALVDPREVISKKTLSVLDEAMVNLREGRAGEPIDLSSFEDSDEEIKEQPEKHSKKR